MSQSASQYRSEANDLNERIKKVMADKRSAEVEFQKLQSSQGEKEERVRHAEKEFNDGARKISEARDKIAELARKEADLHAQLASTERKTVEAAEKERTEKRS